MIRRSLMPSCDQVEKPRSEYLETKTKVYTLINIILIIINNLFYYYITNNNNNNTWNASMLVVCVFASQFGNWSHWSWIRITTVFLAK